MDKATTSTSSGRARTDREGGGANLAHKTEHGEENYDRDMEREVRE